MLQARIEKKCFSDRQSNQERCVLKDIHFEIRGEEFVSLVGPSGCGKSTMLHIIAGLDRAFTGKLTWRDGVDTPKLGYVFQEPRLLPWLNVRDNLALIIDDPVADSPQIDALLQATGLMEFAHFYPAQLSVGMQRRTALARAFLVRPTLLLMDEPFVSLDSPTASQLRRLLLNMWNADRSSVIFVTHDLQEAAMLSDRILFLSTSPAMIIEEMEIPIPREQRLNITAMEPIHLDLERLFRQLYRDDTLP